MTLVAGVDSSTQACKVVVVDADTGEIVRQGRAPHPDGVEANPADWEAALHLAVHAAGGLDDVAALSVAAQQHGLVALDERGEVIRPALLWNDVRAAGAAEELITEAGGPQVWADAVGSVPVSSFTVAKLRWLARHEPEHAARVATVCLPHDWLTWRLGGGTDPGTIVTDRGDASGTGYWSPATGQWRPDLVSLALGREVGLPRVLAPVESAGRTPDGVLLGAGTGDNAAAVLGLDARPGEVLVSVGTSGVACVRADRPTADSTGIVAGFASASGDHLPLVCTLNAARVLEAAATVLGVDQDAFDHLALGCAPGADGLVLVPYLEGERTPNLPDARGSLHGMSLATCTPGHLARAAVEGMLCGLADAVDALPATVGTVLLTGGGARSRAVREIAPTVFGSRVVVPEPAEYVALGAARQAALALHAADTHTGTDTDTGVAAELPAWPRRDMQSFEAAEASPSPVVRRQYAAVAGG